jgi:hypothetical protein
LLCRLGLFRRFSAIGFVLPIPARGFVSPKPTPRELRAVSWVRFVSPKLRSLQPYSLEARADICATSAISNIQQCCTFADWVRSAKMTLRLHRGRCLTVSPAQGVRQRDTYMLIKCARPMGEGHLHDHSCEAWRVPLHSQGRSPLVASPVAIYRGSGSGLPSSAISSEDRTASSLQHGS